MNESVFTIQTLEAYKEVSEMLYYLTTKIIRMEGLKKNHRAYLPVLDEVFALGKNYNQELLGIINEMTDAAVDGMRELEEPKALVLNGDFLLMTSEHFKKMLWQLHSLCFTTRMYLAQTNGEDNESIHYEAIQDMLKVLEKIEDDWERTKANHWPEKGDDVNVG